MSLIRLVLSVCVWRCEGKLCRDMSALSGLQETVCCVSPAVLCSSAQKLS